MEAVYGAADTAANSSADSGTTWWRGRTVVPSEDYVSGDDGLRYYDIVEGKGPTAEKGSTVTVHFDCIYCGITAVSSCESKLLAGNRSIAQRYEFAVGSLPGKERKRDFADNVNGLYSAQQAAPKPPAAMYTITEGMKVGGKRLIVPPELGYGKRGMSEIPSNSFRLRSANKVLGGGFGLRTPLCPMEQQHGGEQCSGEEDGFYGD
ncbi:peptidyl-prolyl cis-trans isomerase FKBP18, chloroplastic-like [Panicum virgatum]|uniref:peptidyl-prolyl cis-trans isomerase FKBP18, chloroplastic-like n=1 Tax=Panicum virgatum TaxID=38727 RepID=UPI0019D65638|nr:peptidyl-prolyl cis-trans isomerase FKBP18, chloroplastic-like [Panicum virgatum]